MEESTGGGCPAWDFLLQGPQEPLKLSIGGTSFLGGTTLFQVKSYREFQYMPNAHAVKEDSSRRPISWITITFEIVTIFECVLLARGLRTQVPTHIWVLYLVLLLPRLGHAGVPTGPAAWKTKTSEAPLR